MWLWLVYKENVREEPLKLDGATVTKLSWTRGIILDGTRPRPPHIESLLKYSSVERVWRQRIPKSNYLGLSLQRRCGEDLKYWTTTGIHV